MSIASEKLNQSSERFLLVRFRPARYIQPPFISGSNYGQTFAYPIAKIMRNGIELTKVDTLSGNDQYTHNENTGALVVRLAAPPDVDSNVIVVYYYLFYTGTIFRSISEDPEDDSTPIRDWSPRITNYPSFAQSIDNIIFGVFTINNTSITLSDSDNDFRQYLTADDSFFNKTIDIWLCIDSVDNIEKIFTGTISSLRLSQNTVNIQVNDAFKQLKKSALMGDDETECIFRRESGGFADLDPSKVNVPVPYIVGSSSRYKTVFSPDSIASAPGYKLISEANESVCIDYTEVVSTATNRTWGACRIKGSIATQSIASGVRSVVAGGYVFLFYNTLSNIVVGDVLRWAHGGTKYGLVVHVGSFTYLANSYNLIVKTSDLLTYTDVVTNLKSFGAVLVKSDASYPLLYQRDYTLSESATTGGNTFVSLVLVNNVEANIGSVDPIDPNYDKILYRASNTEVQTHADILSDMVEDAGLSIDAGSFADAETDLPVNCRFQIPYFDELDFKTYLDYAQDVLKSTLGFLKLNSDFEVEYHLLEAPGSGSIRDKDIMLQDSTSISIEYQDIATRIIAYNPHRENQEALDAVSSPSVTVDSAKSKFLNEYVNVDVFRHLLEEISSRIQAHIDLKSMRQAKYRFGTATQDIDTAIGDDISLDNKIVLGSTNTQNVKVISIDKAPNRTIIEALDLEGL